MPEPEAAAGEAVSAPGKRKVPSGHASGVKKSAPTGDEENAGARGRAQSRPKESLGLKPRGGSSKPRPGLAAAGASVWA